MVPTFRCELTGLRCRFSFLPEVGAGGKDDGQADLLLNILSKKLSTPYLLTTLHDRQGTQPRRHLLALWHPRKRLRGGALAC